MQNYLLYYNGKSNEMLRNSFIIHRVKFIMQEFFQTHSYLSQIFGFLAIAVGILMYQFKKHKTIMILMTLNALVPSLQQLMAFYARCDEFYKSGKELCLQL